MHYALEFGPAVAPSDGADEEFAGTVARFVVGVSYEIPFAIDLIDAAVTDAAVLGCGAYKDLATSLRHRFAGFVKVWSIDIAAAPYCGLVVAVHAPATIVVAYEQIIITVMTDDKGSFYGIGSFSAVGFQFPERAPCDGDRYALRSTHVFGEAHKLYAVPERSECHPGITLLVKGYVGVDGVPVVDTGLRADDLEI